MVLSEDKWSLENNEKTNNDVNQRMADTFFREEVNRNSVTKEWWVFWRNLELLHT